jgi:rhodanese-related sulfurtransferase
VVAAPNDLQAVKQQVESGQAVLIDVREPSEWDTGHVVSAVAVPNRALTKAHQANDEAGLAALLASLPKDKPIYCHCAKGVRAQTAARILKERGYQAVPLEPGYDDLSAAGFATEGGDEPAPASP